MGRISTRWRRFWGIRPGELRPPVSIVGRRRLMGEPRASGHGRGWELRHHALELPAAGAPAVEPSPPVELPLALVADDEIGEEARAHAREVIARVARSAHRPVIRAQVSLRMLRDPALERPAVAKATLDVGGRPVRAHVAAGTVVEAVDLVERRLRRNLERLEELDRSRRHETGIAEPGEWRHSDLPTARPEHYQRPVEERELVRRKTFEPSPLTPEQAALEMQTLDHDFYLFTNVDTAEENVVYRRPDGTVTLVQVTPGAEPEALPIPVDPAPAPLLFLDQAIEQLDLSGERFVFFVDPQTRRGNLLYVRYDGNYGLIEPAVEEPAGATAGT